MRSILAVLFLTLMTTFAMAADRQTLVLATPTADDPYYAEVYDDILAYHAEYVRLASPHDDVVILTDEAGYEVLKETVPEENLAMAPQDDIWMRDFSPVEPKRALQFRYAAAAQGGDQDEADHVQDIFNQAMDKAGIRYRGSEIILDGGNYVSDGRARGGHVIVTERAQDDNDLTRWKLRDELVKLTGASRVAVIPSDDPDGLAHADGMVMFAEPGVLFVTDYRDDPGLRADVIAELEYAFPQDNIVELPAGDPGEDFDPQFASACGIYVNATVTDNAIYLPVFGSRLDQTVQRIIRQNTRKTIVPIPSETVCFMGGSARCLVWQAAGRQAKAIRRLAGAIE